MSPVPARRIPRQGLKGRLGAKRLGRPVHLGIDVAEKAEDADLAATIDPQDAALVKTKADADKAAADATAQQKAAVEAKAAISPSP